MRNSITAVLAACTVTGLTLGAATAATYKFTGTVASNDGLPIAVGEAVSGSLTYDPSAFGIGSLGPCSATSTCTTYNDVLSALSISIGGMTWSMIDASIGEVTIEDESTSISVRDYVGFSSTANVSIDNADGPDLGGFGATRVQFALGSQSDILANEDGVSEAQLLSLFSSNVIDGGLNFTGFEGGEVRFSVDTFSKEPDGPSIVPLPATGILLLCGLTGLLGLGRFRST